MSKPEVKTLDEILKAHGEHFRGMGFTAPPKGTLSTERTKQAILQWAADEVVGDSEVHVSHVCPPDSIGCAKFSQRCVTRNHQIAILKQHGWKGESR